MGSEPSGAPDEPTVRSVLGIKGQLRFHPHGSTQKAHVVLRQVDMSDESDDEGDPSMVYFSLFAQKRIEVKPGKEILLAVATPDGKFLETPVVFAAKVSEEDDSVQAKPSQTLVVDVPVKTQPSVIPPKLRKPWHGMPASEFAISSVPPKALPTYASVAIQAEPDLTVAEARAKPDTASLPPEQTGLLPQDIIEKPPATAPPTSNVSTEAQMESSPERERSLSPMEIDSRSSSRASTPPPTQSPVVQQERSNSNSFSPPGLLVPIPATQQQTFPQASSSHPAEVLARPQSSTPDSEDPPGLSLPPLPHEINSPTTSKVGRNDTTTAPSHPQPTSPIRTAAPVSLSILPLAPQPGNMGTPANITANTSPVGPPSDPSASAAVPYVPKRKTVPNPFVSGGLITDFTGSSTPSKTTPQPPTPSIVETDSSVTLAPSVPSSTKVSPIPSTPPRSSRGSSSIRSSPRSPPPTRSPVQQRRPTPSPPPSPASSSKVKIEDVPMLPPAPSVPTSSSTQFLESAAPPPIPPPPRAQRQRRSRFRNNASVNHAAPSSGWGDTDSTSWSGNAPSGGWNSDASGQGWSGAADNSQSSTAGTSWSSAPADELGSNAANTSWNNASGSSTWGGSDEGWGGRATDESKPNHASVPWISPTNSRANSVNRSWGSAGAQEPRSNAVDKSWEKTADKPRANGAQPSWSNPLGIRPEVTNGWKSNKPLPPQLSTSAPPKGGSKKPVAIGSGWPHNRQGGGGGSRGGRRTSFQNGGMVPPSPVGMPPMDSGFVGSSFIAPVAPMVDVMGVSANPNTIVNGSSPAVPWGQQATGISSAASPVTATSAAMSIDPGSSSAAAIPQLPNKPPAFTGPSSGFDTTRGVKRMGSPTPPSTQEPRRQRTFKWPTSNGLHSVKLKGDDDTGIRKISHSSDGGLFAVTCYDKSVRVWNSKTRTEIAKLAHNMQIIDVAWMDRDAGLVTLGENGIISTWTRSAANKWQWAKILDANAAGGRGDDGPCCLAFCRDRLAVAYPRSGVKIWLFIKGTWSPQRSIVRQNVTAVKFIEDGEALIGGTTDGVLWHCAVPNGTLRAYSFMRTKISTLDIDTKKTHALAAQPTGCILVNIANGDNKGNVEQAYSVKDPDLLSTASYGYGALFASRGAALLFGWFQGCVMVWDRASGSVVHGLYLGEEHTVQAIASFDGSQTFDGHVLVGTRQGQLTWFLQPPTDSAGSVQGAW